MTGSLWRILEDWKGRVVEPAKELPLMYGMVERTAYRAYRPGKCTREERGVATRLNFVNCRADVERSEADGHESAVALMAQCRDEGEGLLRSAHWWEASQRQYNPVDKSVPPPESLIAELENNDFDAQDTIEAVGAMVSFVKYIFGHAEQVVESIIQHLPLYHNRIKCDLLTQGSIPVVCHGIMFSMKKRGFIRENVLGHEWASSGGLLHWGGGGYALLDQAYARNSAVAYVAQLAVIIANAVIQI